MVTAGWVLSLAVSRAHRGRDGLVNTPGWRHVYGLSSMRVDWWTPPDLSSRSFCHAASRSRSAWRFARGGRLPRGPGHAHPTAVAVISRSGCFCTRAERRHRPRSAFRRVQESRGYLAAASSFLSSGGRRRSGVAAAAILRVLGGARARAGTGFPAGHLTGNHVSACSTGLLGPNLAVGLCTTPREFSARCLPSPRRASVPAGGSSQRARTADTATGLLSGESGNRLGPPGPSGDHKSRGGLVRVVHARGAAWMSWPWVMDDRGAWLAVVDAPFESRRHASPDSFSLRSGEALIASASRARWRLFAAPAVLFYAYSPPGGHGDRSLAWAAANVRC